MIDFPVPSVIFIINYYNCIDQKPSNAFIGASWAALIIGFISYNVGLWNGTMLLNEKEYYFTVLLFGLFAAVSVQKSVRDKLENIPVNQHLLRFKLRADALGICFSD
ncbi:YiaA/B family two helix domain-containing protein [Mucilaginibacter gracilis]|uniref:YiaA/B family two helix domain-containing protein n=1 Tax=Mucilaginibacter gracilis TaxID=423350 RepID=A0A495J631_9SPHI|nr:YiaA/YiaB family inner membrane protein [Mucilaginibacter gracilis]RKR84456.1 YiaA/B family two helix domain-containing protein [Mucilaginibacter gracilis]